MHFATERNLSCVLQILRKFLVYFVEDVVVGLCVQGHQLSGLRLLVEECRGRVFLMYVDFGSYEDSLENLQVCVGYRVSPVAAEFEIALYELSNFRLFCILVYSPHLP